MAYIDLLCVHIRVSGHTGAVIHIGKPEHGQQNLFLALYYTGFWCLAQVSRIRNKSPYLMNQLTYVTFNERWTLYHIEDIIYLGL